MNCTECGSPLMIADSKLETEIGSTDIYSVLTMVCINSQIDPVSKKQVCSLYCGKDLNKPLRIAATVRNKVN